MSSKSSRDGGACQPGCKCGRHNPRHKPDCNCPRHRMRKPTAVFDASIDGVNKQRPCVCGHVYTRHDPFGCKTCEQNSSTMRNFNGKRLPVCNQFRARNTNQQRDPNTFTKEVAKNGFIRHIGELAICTVCWQSIKIGLSHTLTSVIHARAHRQKCDDSVRAKQVRSSPDRATGVG